MGSISLMCPMCCGETFSNSESLKYHLLSMTDNLYCPACSLRTYSVAALIQHLDSCGKVTEEDQSKEDMDNDKLKENAKEGPDILMEGDDAITDSFLATVNEEGIMIVDEGRTIQVDENGDIQVLGKLTAIPDDESMHMATCDKDVTSTSEEDNQVSESSALLVQNSDMSSKKDETITNISLLNENDNGLISMAQFDEVQFDDQGILIVKKENLTAEKEEEEVMYSCSTCGMSFTSVLEHIKVYHDGQEVVLEMAEQQIDEIENATIEAAPINSILDTSQTANSTTKKTNVPMKQRQSMNTLRTEECIDSDGRSYTRKVVQIERFWDRTPVNLSSTKAPMIEKFFSNVEGVKVRDKSVTVAPTKMYRCNQCLEQFPKLGDFRVHMCLQGNNRCDQCDQTFATMKALQSHMKVHENSDFPSQKIFLCTVCGTEFLTHKSLRLHSRMHNPVRARHVDAPEGTEEETFDCKECGTTLSESYRAAHMALHAGNTITCSVCNRKFDSAESLAMHAAVHNEQQVMNSPSMPANDLSIANSQDSVDNTFVSANTTDITNTATATTAAESADAQNSTKPYQCQHCGRRFTRPHEKVKHERIHTGEKPHSCEVCGKTFRVSYCLTLHMRTHTGVRPYECQHCGKRFKASSVYNHHLLTHGEERAYTCPYCPKTFKTRVQLAGHKNSHTKPFRCTECSRPFASLYAARAHIQTHKKDNNLKFSCHICGASYGRAFALKDHIKQHEKENTLMPPEAAREEEIQEVESFLVQDEEEPEEELIVPSPPARNSMSIDLDCD